MAAEASGDSEKCLADLRDHNAPTTGQMRWNADGDRVIIGTVALSGDLTQTTPLSGNPGEAPKWSRPTGTSVVYIEPDGSLMKRGSSGGRAVDISFLASHDDVVYHPAGTHIATSGSSSDGSYGLYLATNLGTEEQLIARGEAAKFITDLHFSEDGRYLYYTAQHGPTNWHLHRLTIGKDAILETLDKAEGRFSYSVSPWDWSRLAWLEPGDCGAGRPGTLHFPDHLEDRFTIPPELAARNLEPIGWLPSGDLVVRSFPTRCTNAPLFDVYVLSRDEPVLIVNDTYGSVAVRAPLPPPPPPPGEEQEVVA
jgi:hypothetical protein